MVAPQNQSQILHIRVRGNEFLVSEATCSQFETLANLHSFIKRGIFVHKRQSTNSSDSNCEFSCSFCFSSSSSDVNSDASTEKDSNEDALQAKEHASDYCLETNKSKLDCCPERIRDIQTEEELFSEFISQRVDYASFELLINYLSTEKLPSLRRLPKLILAADYLGYQRMSKIYDSSFYKINSAVKRNRKPINEFLSLNSFFVDALTRSHRRRSYSRAVSERNLLLLFDDSPFRRIVCADKERRGLQVVQIPNDSALFDVRSKNPVEFLVVNTDYEAAPVWIEEIRFQNLWLSVSLPPALKSRGRIKLDRLVLEKRKDSFLDFKLAYNGSPLLEIERQLVIYNLSIDTSTLVVDRLRFMRLSSCTNLDFTGVFFNTLEYLEVVSCTRIVFDSRETFPSLKTLSLTMNNDVRLPIRITGKLKKLLINESVNTKINTKSWCVSFLEELIDYSVCPTILFDDRIYTTALKKLSVSNGIVDFRIPDFRLPLSGEDARFQDARFQDARFQDSRFDESRQSFVFNAHKNTGWNLEELEVNRYHQRNVVISRSMRLKKLVIRECENVVIHSEALTSLKKLSIMNCGSVKIVGKVVTPLRSLLVHTTQNLDFSNWCIPKLKRLTAINMSNKSSFTMTLLLPDSSFLPELDVQNVQLFCCRVYLGSLRV